MLKRKGSTFVLLVVAMTAAGCSQLVPQATPIVEFEPVEDFVPVVSATGVVVPAQFSTLSMRTAGVVAEVLVGEDDLISAGQVLVRLEGKEELQATIEASRLEVLMAQQDLDALYEDPELRVAQALQSVVGAKQDIDDAQRRINNLRASSPKPDIDQARANLILAEDKLDKARKDYEPYKDKREDNVIRAAKLSKLAQAQKEYDAVVRLLNNLLGSANELDLAEAEADLALAEARLAKAERDYEMFQVGPDPDDMDLAEERLATARTQLASAEAALDDLELRAPFDGTVSELYVHDNEWVSPGQPVLLLADLGHLWLETTDLSEIDVAQIKVGDSAKVTFDALPGVEVTGTVVRIASKSTRGAGVNYTVVIELEQVPDALRWGMTAFVDIEID